MRLGIKTTEKKVVASLPGVKGWGHLRCVTQLADQPGLNKKRALVSTYEDPAGERICECGHRLASTSMTCRECGRDVSNLSSASAVSPTIGKIIWRQGERYLVRPDNVKPWIQVLKFETEGLQELKLCLQPPLVKRPGMPDMPQTPREGLEGPMKIANLPQIKKALQKGLEGFCVAVEYEKCSDATGDMELSRLQDGFYVQAIRPGGLAYEAGVRGGHMLSTLKCADAKLLKNDKPVWCSLDPHQDLPAVLRPLPECQHISDVDDLEWPIRLEFHTLPLGWRLVGEAPLAERTTMPGGLPGVVEEKDKQDGKEKTLRGPFTLASLDDLIAAGQSNV
jgi:hypothetical protein